MKNGQGWSLSALTSSSSSDWFSPSSSSSGTPCTSRGRESGTAMASWCCQWPAVWTHCTLGRCLMWHYFTWKTRNAQTASVWPHVMHSPFSWVLSVRRWTKAHENCVAPIHFATLKKTTERSQKSNSNYFIQKSRNWKNKNKKLVQSEFFSTQFSKD